MDCVQAVTKFVNPRCDFIEVDDFFLAVSLDDEHDSSVRQRFPCITSGLMGQLIDAECANRFITSSVSKSEYVMFLSEELCMD